LYSHLSAPSAVHNYRVPGKFIRRLKSLLVFSFPGIRVFRSTNYLPCHWAFVLAAKQAWKTRRRLAILPVSKARTTKFYIYRQCTYIVYDLVFIFYVFMMHWKNKCTKNVFGHSWSYFDIQILRLVIAPMYESSSP
jgi:hypothetical protein